jgi:hypothetical protein
MDRNVLSTWRRRRRPFVRMSILFFAMMLLSEAGADNSANNNGGIPDSGDHILRFEDPETVASICPTSKRNESSDERKYNEGFLFGVIRNSSLSNRKMSGNESMIEV